MTSPLQMAKVTPIRKLKPGIGTTVIGRITAKSNKLTYDRNKKYFTVSFTDGTEEIDLTLFGARHLRKYYTYIKYDKVYRFSHFTVRKRDPQYDDAGLDNPLQLTSWTNTKVELCDDWMCTQVPLLKFAIELDFRYTVAKIRRLPRGTVIDVIGVCDQIIKSTNIKKRPHVIKLKDHTGRLMIRINAKFGEKLPFKVLEEDAGVVAMRRVKLLAPVTGEERQPLLMNLRVSKLYINPDDERTLALRIWYKKMLSKRQ